jgi:hypothetical protein
MKNLFHAKLRALKGGVPVHNMKAYGGSLGTVPIILHLDRIWW